MPLYMISERESSVLDTIIRDYVTSAVPVSSKRVLDIAELQLSPASIRSIMADLEDAGYILQPHTSAGRVPTQKGYRFFVDNLMEAESSLPQKVEARIRAAESVREGLKAIAEETHVCVIAVLPEYDMPTNFGLANLFQEPEFGNEGVAAQFGKLIDAMLEQHHVYANAVRQTGFGIFIERENMLPEARSASVIVSLLAGRRGMLCAVGPTRMNYERLAKLLRLSASILEP